MMLSTSIHRAAVHAALALLVVGSLSHCSWEESRELAQLAQALALHEAGQPTPIQAPVHDCDRESGCICRGATLVHAIDSSQLTDLASQPCLELDAAQTPGSWQSAVGDVSRNVECLFFEPLISGRQLRALYASLVI